jgi:hypothetical protein
MVQNGYYPAVCKNVMPEAAENFQARCVTPKFGLLLLSWASSYISIRWVEGTGCRNVV